MNFESENVDRDEASSCKKDNKAHGRETQKLSWGKKTDGASKEEIHDPIEGNTEVEVQKKTKDREKPPKPPQRRSE